MSHSTSQPHFSLSQVDLGEDIDFVLGATAVALTGDQLIKATKSKNHKVSHLIKAGIGAAAAYGAWTMFRHDHKEHHEHHGPHEHQDNKESHRGRHRSKSPPPSRREEYSPSPSDAHAWHGQRLVESGYDHDGNAHDIVQRRRYSVHEYQAHDPYPDLDYGYGRAQSLPPRRRAHDAV